MKTINIKGKPHYLFDSVEEFNKWFSRGASPTPEIRKDWRTAEEGDWVLADDGGVCQILKKGDIKNNKYWNKYVVTAIGSYPCYKGIKMDTDPSLHTERHRFGISINPKKDRMSRREKEFVINIMRGDSIHDAYVKVYGDSPFWKTHAFAILRRPVVMEEIKKSVKDIADSLGITYKYVLSKYKELAEESKSEAVKLGAIKELAQILENISDERLNPNKEIGFSGFNRKQIEGVIEDAEIEE